MLPAHAPESSIELVPRHRIGGVHGPVTPGCRSFDAVHDDVLPVGVNRQTLGQFSPGGDPMNRPRRLKGLHGDSHRRPLDIIRRTRGTGLRS